MWSLILLVAGVVAFLYLTKELKKVSAKVADIEKAVEHLGAFQNDLVNMVGEDSAKSLGYLHAYLLLKRTHHFSALLQLATPRPDYDYMDWQAVGKRQEKELSDLREEARGQKLATPTWPLNEAGKAHYSKKK